MSEPRPIGAEDGLRRPAAASGSPAYLSGLLLAGRRVVVVGGGRVANRRVPRLVAAGADVVVIAPRAHPTLAGLAAAGSITWHHRPYAPGDLDDTWYVIAATDAPEVNALVTADAEARHTFCVRADRGDAGSAWTPATGDVAGVTIAVVAGHDPLRSRRIRDRMAQVIAAEGL